MQPHHSRQYGALFTVLALVVTMLGVSSLPARAGAPASAIFTLNSLYTPITTITRLSVDSSGIQGNNWSEKPSISADGRYVAFSSTASNLVSGDTNNSTDIFLRHTQTGTTTRLSVDSGGVQGNYDSYSPSISADGRYVAFVSRASNLVSGDTNNSTDIFLRDTQMGTTTRISVDSGGVQRNEGSYSPSISADGRYVAFYSGVSKAVTEYANSTYDIFLRDTQTGTTTRISVDSNGVQGNDESINPSISADGHYVAFSSTASNLVSGDTNGRSDIFLRDTQTGTTLRLSLDSSGIQGNGDSYSPSISADGRYVAFSSTASNLVSGDTDGNVDIFLRDTQTGTDTRLSLDSSGVQGNNVSITPSISADGRYVAFQSTASNLVGGDTNSRSDIFLRDMQTGTILRLSLDSSGTQGNGWSDSPSISADGRYVVFDSEASNLVSGDTNGKGDVFIVPATYRIYLPLVVR